MLSSPKQDRPRTLDELLGSELIARIDRLDLVSRQMFPGKLPGERRSKSRGRSVEFDDHRVYTPGDDLRHIDWNVLARLDRLFIKLFREDEDLALLLVLDVSASMDSGEPNKMVFAHRLAMALGYVGLVNRNRVMLATFGHERAPGLRQYGAMRGRRAVETLSGQVLGSLAAMPERATGSRPPVETFDASIRRLGAARLGRGVVVLVSDMLEVDGLERGLSFLAQLGGGAFDVHVLQTLAPDELEPELAAERGLSGDLRLEDPEGARAAEVTVTPGAIASYKKRLQQHIDRVRDACRVRGAHHTLVRTDAKLDRLIVEDLRRHGLVH